MAEWKFRERQRNEENRDPNEEEFFRQQDPVHGFVRESIQNSLDARSGSVADVVFTISGEEWALSEKKANKWFGTLPPHVRAANMEVPDSDDAGVRFVAVEDFQTVGLTGDPEEWKAADSEEEGQENNFRDFWRWSGRSFKSGDQKGSWGLGKYVFPATSQIHSYLGWTKTPEHSDKGLLMGKSVLRIHQIDGSIYDSTGYFADFAEDNFQIPIKDRRTIREFERDFHLRRSLEGEEDNQGVSVVVPYPVDALNDADALAPVLGAVVEHFFFPVYHGHLTVEVRTPQDDVRISHDNIKEVINTYPLEYDNVSAETVDYVLDVCELWDRSNEYKLPVEKEARNPKWSTVQWDELSFDKIRERWWEGKPCLFQIKDIPVRPKSDGKEVENSTLQVGLMHVEGLEDGVSFFLRDGLTVPKVKYGRAPGGVVGLVVSQGDGLAELLRAAENPAHRNWSQRASRLTDQFVAGSHAVRFVKNAIEELVRKITKPGREPDITLLADVFPEPDIDGRKTGKKEEEGEDENGELPDLPEGGPEIVVYDVENPGAGFKLTVNKSVENDRLRGRRLDVQVAYDTMRGNPFKNYRTEDFSFGDDGALQIEADGGRIVKAEANNLVLEIESEDVSVLCTGFDAHRDIVVRSDFVNEEEDVGT